MGGGGGIPVVTDVIKGAVGLVTGVTGLVMGSDQSKSGAPGLPPPPPSPTSDPAEKKKTDASAESAADAERRSRGRASTMLTGSSGDTSKATVSRRTLLGG